MVSEFSPRSFFLKVPNELLKTYFARRGELTDFSWEGFALFETDPLFVAWRELPEDRRDQAEAEMRCVAEIGTPEGVRLLVEEAKTDGLDLAQRFAKIHGPWAQAFYVFLEHREVFDRACRFDDADDLNARYWRKRGEVPRKDPDVSPDGCRALETGIGDYFRVRDGRGGLVHARWDLRGGRRDYFSVHPLDGARLVEDFDEHGEFRRHAARSPFLVVFVYDREDGTLAVNARGDRRLHADLLQIFTRAILGEDLAPETQAPAPFRLNVLKRRDFAFATEPGGPIERVRVKSLRTAHLCGGRITYDAEAFRRRRNIYDLIEDSGHPLTNVDVDRVGLQMFFRFMEGPRVLPVTMTPHRWSLGDTPEDLIARECLVRSGLACA